MDDDASVWPMDLDQLLAVVFRAQGYLVVILADGDEGRTASEALEGAGVAHHDLKLYTSEEILEIHEGYVERRTVAGKVVGVFMDDDAGRDLYLGYAKEGRSALWVRLPDETDVPKVLRVLADREYLHARYYGEDRIEDFHLS
jgi:hypothetical protein